MSDELVEREARAWAEEIVAGGPWGPERFRVELADQRWVVGRGGQERCQVRFRLWEACGWARVELDTAARARRVVLPPGASGEPLPGAPPAPQLVERAAAAAFQLAAERGELRPLRAREVRREAPSPRQEAGELALGFLLERHPVDGRLVVDLDPPAEDEPPGLSGPLRVGFLCEPLFRHTNRSAALSRGAAVRRARAALELPAAARLVAARLCREERGRVWKLRWKVDDPALQGALLATLNARTGRVGLLVNTVRPRPQVERTGGERASAERQLRRAVARRLGPEAQVGGVVRGASRGERAWRETWLAAVRAPDGALFSAVLDQGKVVLRRTG